MTSAAVSRQPILSPPQLDQRNNRTAMIGAMIVFGGLAGWFAIATHGDVETDAIMHYMIARHSFTRAIHLVSVWGRPLCTLAYAIPAQLGRQVGARLMSVLMALAIAGVTHQIARWQKMRFPALAVILLFSQPLFFIQSWSSLTEIPFALCLSLAFWAYQRRYYLLTALLAGLTPLGRLEGLGFAVIVVFALLAHRSWLGAVVVAVPFLLWNYAGWVINERPWGYPWWTWVSHNSPYSSASMYGHGPVWWYVAQMPMIVGPFGTPFFFVGAWWCLKRADPLERRSNAGLVYPAPIRWILVPNNHLARCDAWIVYIPLMVLALHSVLWWRGWMASAGYVRYMVMVAPFWALVTARGVEWISGRFAFPHPLRWAEAGAILPLLFNWHMYPDRPELPFPKYDDDYIATAIADWYTGDPKWQHDYPMLISTPPTVWLRLDVDHSDPKRVASRDKKDILKPGNGTVLIWDFTYGQQNSSEANVIPFNWIASGQWVYAGRFQCGPKFADVYLSPKKSDGQPTPPPDPFLIETGD